MRDKIAIGVLDHGYLRLVDSWGSDESIVEAARMSTQKGFLGWGPRCSECDFALPEHEAGCAQPDRPGVSGDEKLLKYLYEHKHSTPFEFGGLVIEVQAPIFVFREWHRHRTQSYNEASARYAPLPDLNYVPTVERLMVNSKANKQAGTVAGAEALTETRAALYREHLKETYTHLELRYQEALQFGVPKELARVHLPVGRYSRMRASANLRCWLMFLTLRMDKNAQWEIRQYADALGTIVAEKFPRTWALFAEGQA
jgi:thymidylate synthase (FAD)